MSEQRPAPGEYPKFYAPYIDVAEQGGGPNALFESQETSFERLSRLDAETAAHRYAAGKWSVAEVAGHLGDAERIFGYRALRISRGDQTPLPGFDEEAFVGAARFGDRSMDDLAGELTLLRRSNRALFGVLGDDRLALLGIANGHEISVRAIVWSIAGHAQHHLQVLRDRYGVDLL